MKSDDVNRYGEPMVAVHIRVPKDAYEALRASARASNRSMARELTVILRESALRKELRLVE